MTDPSELPEALSLDEAFAPREFAALGERLLAKMTEELANCRKPRDGDDDHPPIMPRETPEAMMAATPSPADRRQNLDEILDRFYRGSTRLHDPHCIGHQVAAPLPGAALFHALTALVNNGMAVFEMGAAATAMERRGIEWMAALAGFPSEAEGFFTSGGSLGNLTALLTARQVKAGLDAQGVAGIERPAILVSEEAHYCSARAAHVMGWGAEGLVQVATDDRFRMAPEDLPRAMAEAKARGRTVIAVVASACSTSTGSYDPLHPIADFCEAEELWLHVDGAHGASALLSPDLRGRLDGIERADSLVWDAHKLLMMPALSTAVIYRRREHASRALAQRASYLFDGDPDLEWFNVGHRTVECTKTMMASVLYASLALYGESLFREHVERVHMRAREFADRLEESEDFRIACRPESNIVCFRHEPTGAANLDELQRRLRRELVSSGAFYVVQTSLEGRPWLRCTIMNPMIDFSHLESLMTHLRTLAARTDGED